MKSIVTITNNGKDASYFESKNFPLTGTPERFLSERINALNFRIRTSDAGYHSDFHVAGDPTLIAILKGTLRVELRNGEAKVFEQGDMFIAEDFLEPEERFIDGTHGHSAQVMGEQPLEALHIKLSSR